MVWRIYSGRTGTICWGVSDGLLQVLGHYISSMYMCVCVGIYMYMYIYIYNKNTRIKNVLPMYYYLWVCHTDLYTHEALNASMGKTSWNQRK